MRLYLMRHAQPLTLDNDSRLSSIGDDQVRQVIALFSQFHMDGEKVAVLSTKVPRAQRTAEILGQGLGLRSDHVTQIPDVSGPGDSFLRAHLLFHIRKPLEQGCNDVIFAGHAPYFPLLIEHLTGAYPNDLSPYHGSVASLEGEPGSQGDWQLHWWLSPMPTTSTAAEQPSPA